MLVCVCLMQRGMWAGGVVRIARRKYLVCWCEPCCTLLHLAHQLSQHTHQHTYSLNTCTHKPNNTPLLPYSTHHTQQAGDDKKLAQAASRKKKLEERHGLEKNAKGMRFKVGRGF